MLRVLRLGKWRLLPGLTLLLGRLHCLLVLQPVVMTCLLVLQSVAMILVREGDETDEWLWSGWVC